MAHGAKPTFSPAAPAAPRSDRGGSRSDGERSEPERREPPRSLRARFRTCPPTPAWFWLAAMQLRASQIQGDRPACPVNPRHKTHAHGSYARYANCNDQRKVDIPIFLCPHCSRTLSVLPDDLLPYRHVPVSLLEAHFDAQANPGQSPPPPATEKETGGLRRAWARFLRRVTPLVATLGQIIRTLNPTAVQLWNELREPRPLPAILHLLAHPFHTSLLLDYRCLRPWATGAD